MPRTPLQTCARPPSSSVGSAGPTPALSPRKKTSLSARTALYGSFFAVFLQYLTKSSHCSRNTTLRPRVSIPAGMAGVYDIETHLHYEAGRGVQYLSTMERAMGGRERFAAQSPTVILARAAPPSAGAARYTITPQLRSIVGLI